MSRDACGPGAEHIVQTKAGAGSPWNTEEVWGCWEVQGAAMFAHVFLVWGRIILCISLYA